MQIKTKHFSQNVKCSPAESQFFLVSPQNIRIGFDTAFGHNMVEDGYLKLHFYDMS